MIDYDRTEPEYWWKEQWPKYKDRPVPPAMYDAAKGYYNPTGCTSFKWIRLGDGSWYGEWYEPRTQ